MGETTTETRTAAAPLAGLGAVLGLGAIAAGGCCVLPLAFAAFEDYRMGGVTLSSKAVDVLKRRLQGEEVTRESSGMSIGEWREFVGVWG